MSFTSPQQAASAEAARFNAGQANRLADISLPAIQSTLSSLFSDINVGANGAVGVPKSVDRAYTDIATQTNTDFASTGRSNNAYTIQAAKQSGNQYAPGAISDALKESGTMLEASRRDSQRSIEYEKQVTGLEEYNQILNLIGAGSGSALNLASGWSGAQAQAIGGLSNQSKGGGALTGAISGAGAGAAAGPYGALIGAVVGGAGGYFSAGG